MGLILKSVGHLMMCGTKYKNIGFIHVKPNFVQKKKIVFGYWRKNIWVLCLFETKYILFSLPSKKKINGSRKKKTASPSENQMVRPLQKLILVKQKMIDQAICFAEYQCKYIHRTVSVQLEGCNNKLIATCIMKLSHFFLVYNLRCQAL